MNICILIGTFRPDVAYRVMMESTCTNKGCHKSVLQHLQINCWRRNVMLELKTEVMDAKCGLTVDERKEKLLKLQTQLKL